MEFEARLNRTKSPETRERLLTEAVESQRGKLLSFIRRRIRDQAEAEDVFQEVVEEFVEAYDLNQVIGALGAWLVRVAQNKVIDRFRRKKTQADYRASLALNEEGAISPDEEWRRAWLRAELVDALALLPKEQREVFVQHELEGKSFEEIAAESGESVNTLLSRKRYAVLFLRKHLKEVYDELEG